MKNVELSRVHYSIEGPSPDGAPQDIVQVSTTIQVDESLTSDELEIMARFLTATMEFYLSNRPRRRPRSPDAPGNAP